MTAIAIAEINSFFCYVNNSLIKHELLKTVKVWTLVIAPITRVTLTTSSTLHSRNLEADCHEVTVMQHITDATTVQLADTPVFH